MKPIKKFNSDLKTEKQPVISETQGSKSMFSRQISEYDNNGIESQGALLSQAQITQNQMTDGGEERQENHKTFSPQSHPDKHLIFVSDDNINNQPAAPGNFNTQSNSDFKLNTKNKQSKSKKRAHNKLLLHEAVINSIEGTPNIHYSDVRSRENLQTQYKTQQVNTSKKKTKAISQVLDPKQARIIENYNVNVGLPMPGQTQLSNTGNYGRRKLVVPELSSLHQNYKVTTHAQTHKKSAAHQFVLIPETKKSKKQGQTKRSNMPNQLYTQTTSNFNQCLKEATAERQLQLKQGRKNQPVPIDTFNIVSNRRKSLVKQVNEANANSDAALQMIKSGPVSSQTFDISEMTNKNSNNPNLILPQISKSGMNSYQFRGSQTGVEQNSDYQKSISKYASHNTSQNNQTQMNYQGTNFDNNSYQRLTPGLGAGQDVSFGNHFPPDHIADRIMPRNSENKINLVPNNGRITDQGAIKKEINEGIGRGERLSQTQARKKTDKEITETTTRQNRVNYEPAKQIPYYQDQKLANQHKEFEQQRNGTPYSESGSSDDGSSSDQQEELAESQGATGSRQSLQMQPQDKSFLQTAGDSKQGTASGTGTQNGQRIQYHQRPKQQKNTANGSMPKEKKKKKHRRHNTHHHYHIDFNFEQVNNILVSYGGVGLHQQLKQQMKKDSSKANVSLSLGVINGQFGQSGNSSGQNVNYQHAHTDKSSVQAPGSPTKRIQMQHNALQLPELIINKNKINFGTKKLKVNLEDAKIAHRPHKDPNHAVSQQYQDIAGRGQKSKRKKNKRETYNPEDYPYDKRAQDSFKSPMQEGNDEEPHTGHDPNFVYQKDKGQSRFVNQSRTSKKSSHASKSNHPGGHMADGLAKQNSRVGSQDNGLHPLDDLRQWSIDNKEALDDLSNKQELHKQQAESKAGNPKTIPLQNINLENKSANPPPRKAQRAGIPPLPASNQIGNGQVRAPINLRIDTRDNDGSPTRKLYGKKSEKFVKVASHEHHSAQLRPNRADSAEMMRGAQDTGKNNFNTLSQVSSANEYETSRYQTSVKEKSGLAQSGEGRPVDRNFPASAHHYRAGGASRKQRSLARDQERKLKQLGDQSKRTQQLLDQFNSGSRPLLDQGEASVADGSGSPTYAQKMANIKANKPKITDFELQEVVGTGNFGKVHKAYNNRDKRVCAIKILKKEGVSQMKQVDHIISEREVLQFLVDKNKMFFEETSHQREPGEALVPECPFLMGIYSSFQDKENLYFELEYIEGCTLLSQIRLYNSQVQKNMPYYVAEVLFALEYLHKNNIIYRDLKPENVVISMAERGHIKLVDFGFAKQLQTITQRTNTNCGTPAYIAPEVLRGDHSHGFEADIWSLGVLIVELASGQTPFHAESTQGVYEKILLCQPVYNKFITQPMRELLGKIFVPDPNQRISLAEIKQSSIFKDFDWSVPMRDRFTNSCAPFIPSEPMFGECVNRFSEEVVPAKPKNILAAIMGNPGTNDEQQKPKEMEFDEGHYNKFQRDDKTANRDREIESRKRQQPLGDFKFKRINEYF